MQTYSTSQAAKLVQVHPNTVRFYEEMNLLPPIPRQKNGYRRYNDYHIAQLRLIRIAFDSEIVSGNLRKMTIDIIQAAAAHKLDEAIKKTKSYKEQIQIQKKNAEEAVEIIESMLKVNDTYYDGNTKPLTGKEVSASLGISKDVIRDWERNGLIEVPRDIKGYRVYNTGEIQRLKIIRTLRNAHYSMMSILRMLSQVNHNIDLKGLKEVIDTPLASENIITVTDQFITSLDHADRNADKIFEHLFKMKDICY